MELGFVEALGWLGTILLALSSLPQLITTLKTKTTEGLSVLMIWCVCIGCTSMFIYIAIMAPRLPLLINYTFNVVINALIIYYYYKYKKN